MKSLISKQVERFLREQKNYKRWLAVFLCLAVVVTIGTAAALKYKGIAVTKDGEMHVHTDDCYREEKVLVCEEAKSAEGHTHDDSCYSVTGGTEELTCDKEEHTHDSSCYSVEIKTETETDEEGNETTVEREEEVLTCDKEEHTHDSSCYSVVGGERTLTCGLEESEGTAVSDHVHDDSCYEIRKVLICGENADEAEDPEEEPAEEPVEEIIEDVSGNDAEEEILEDVSGNDLPAEPVVQECEDEDGTVKVIAEYGPEAGLPENAELKVKRIWEDDADYQKYEEEFKEELENEEAKVELLLDVGFYVDGEEVEPTGTVSITVQILDNSINMNEKTDIVHFGKEKESFMGVDVEEDNDGNKSTNIELSSFSTIALGSSEFKYTKYAPDSIDKLNGKSFLITLRFDDGNGDKFNRILIDESSSSGLGGKDFSGEEKFTTEEKISEWTFIKSNVAENAFSIQNANGMYLNIGEYSLGMDQESQTLFVDLNQSTGEIQIKNEANYCLSINYWDKYFVSNVNQYTDNVLKNLTLYTSEEIEVDPNQFTVKYWLNENSTDRFRVPTNGNLFDAGTSLGKIRVPIKEEDNKKLVEIPLTGITDEGIDIGRPGNSDSEQGVLDYGGHKHLFYGWSRTRDANYLWADMGLPQENPQRYVYGEKYCGEDFLINGKPVPTYVESGKLVLDVSEFGEKSIDLFAIWATPNEEGVVYYGGGNTAKENLKNPDAYGVKFYVNVTGQIPHEPGSFPVSNFTAGVRAYDKEKGEYVDNPLKYWMHIYGNENREAIHANLKCEPKDEDILAAIQAKGNIVIDNETIDFKGMSLENFKRDYYVEWYVCKDHDDNWHIDGALIKKSNWRLTYEGNGATFPSTIIPSTSYPYTNKVTVKNTVDGNGQQSNEEPVKLGYNFAGWNTREDGSGTWFYLGDVISVNQETGQVFKGEDSVNGLIAEKNDNDVRELTLYAQWTKGTNSLKVTKTDKNNIPLKGAKFTLNECEQNEAGILQPTKVGEAITSENGVLTINDLKNDTYYRLDESYAPNGYGIRTIYFSVVVPENKDGNMSISILNEKAEKIETPNWLEKEYIGNGSSSGTGGLASINFKIEDEAIFQNVHFKKIDENGEPMEGVKFELYREENTSSGKEYITKGESNETKKAEDGEFSFNNLSTLPYGKYCLKEITAPTNYKKVAVYFEINDPVGDGSNGMVVTKVAEIDGTEENEIKDFDPEDYLVVPETEKGTTIDSNGNTINVTGYSYTLTIKNQLKAQTVLLEKRATDGTDKLLSGAKFSIYKAPVDTEADKAVSEGTEQPNPSDKVKETEETDQSGRTSLGELDAGTYYLFEEKAPEGYILPTKPVKIVVRNDGVTVYNGGSETTAERDDISKAYIVKIYNSTGAILPETGGPGTVAYTFGGLAVIAVGLMYGLSMRRKREKGGLN